jgi:hypothetical protein
MTALILAAFGTPVCALIVAISVGVLLEPMELSAIRSVGKGRLASGSMSELPGRPDRFGPGSDRARPVAP